MKFFYINNSLCTQCTRCQEVCPTVAIYNAEDHTYINYDKCNSCGNCVKTCNVAAITVESIQKMVSEMEKADTYKSRIARLENEFAILDKESKILRSAIDNIIGCLSSAAFIIDAGGIIQTSNSTFRALCAASLVSSDTSSLSLTGQNIYNLIPENIIKLMRLTIPAQNATEHVSEINKIPVSIAFHPLDGNYTLALIDNLKEKNVAGEKILSLIKRAIDRKMAMVQQIGTLLGEETSAELGELNSVIKILESDTDE